MLTVNPAPHPPRPVGNTEEGLGSFTREDLCKFYDEYPLEPVSPDVARLQGALRGWAERLRSEFGATSSAAFEQHPMKLDENMWRIRYHCEELEALAGSAPAAAGLDTELLAELTREFRGSFAAVERFQDENTKRITKLVQEWMPDDFRGYLIDQQRESGELKRKQEIDDLMAEGGSIKDKYDLLWEQQMDRRKALEALGSASGMFKYVVALVAGVPESLLDFLKSINDPNGPMEEQRARYGPDLYQVTDLGAQLLETAALWWAAEGVDGGGGLGAAEREALRDVVRESALLHHAETERLSDFLDTVFKNSPFLVPNLAAGGPPEGTEEVNIAAGALHEVEVEVEGAGTTVAWNWCVDAGYEVDFSVEFSPEEGGEPREVQAVERLENHVGSFDAAGPGTCRFVWDNALTWMFSKNLSFKIGTVPLPVAEPPASSPNDTVEAV